VRRTLSTLSIESTSIHHSRVNIDSFRDQSFLPGKPHLFESDEIPDRDSLPARDTWFKKLGINGDASETWAFSSYLDHFLDWPFPYEVVSAAGKQEAPLIAFRNQLLQSRDLGDHVLAGLIEPVVSDLGTRTFFQLFAPLKLLKLALEFNREQLLKNRDPLQLYIAQSSLTDLPKELTNSLPTPPLVGLTGKGDIYDSSIWLGTEPTYTPLHRDPNPNLFCQLCSRKLVRLLPPNDGDQVFFEVQVRIRQQGNSRIRTTDMMEGKEREALHEAVWENNALSGRIYEVDVGPGDALFIPKGWWHSIKSKQTLGGLNASANWWFR
jgi:hypothetical protein